VGSFLNTLDGIVVRCVKLLADQRIVPSVLLHRRESSRKFSEAAVYVTSSVLDVHVTLHFLAKCTSRTGSHDVS